MLLDIIFRTHLDVFRRALLGDPPARVDPMTVRLQRRARPVRAKPRASPLVHIAGNENCWGDLLSRWVTLPGGGGLLVRERQLRGGASTSFRRRRLCAGVQTASAEGGPPVVRR